MSCLFIVVPVVTASWPVITGLTAAVAAKLGYNMLTEQVECVDTRINAQSHYGVQVSVTEGEVLAEGLRPEETLVLVKDDFRVTVARDARGALSIHVDSETCSSEEIEAEAQKVVNALRRQFAYAKTVQALKEKGYSIVEEEVEEEGRIRLLLRRFKDS